MEDAKPQCGSADGDTQEYDLPLHVVGLFLVLIASCFGAGFPVAAKKIKWLNIPPKIFFACKHFGTGVLIATAFVHLLPTAFGNLLNPCLPDFFIVTYPPLAGVIMMGSLFALFVIEMYLNAKTGGHSHGGPTGQDFGHIHHSQELAMDGTQKNKQQRSMDRPTSTQSSVDTENTVSYEKDLLQKMHNARENSTEADLRQSTMPAWFVVFYEQYIRDRSSLLERVAGYRQDSSSSDSSSHGEKSGVVVSQEYLEEEKDVDPAVLKKMSANITMLEGGILFHSVFVGMTVSITIDGFVVLLISILFHQVFEGLGLGSRIAAVPYAKNSIRPWVLVFAFGLTAPIGQAIGLITRNTYDPESAFGLIIVGVFNAISSGLLIYAALVDLLAEDFLSEEAQHLMKGRTRTYAFCWVLAGAVGMSIVGAFA